MTTILTNILIPPLAPTLVQRQRLLDALDAGAQRRLTLITAHAGFGKTTMLSAWAHTQTRVAWLTLDANDNDVRRLLTDGIAALQRVEPQFGTTTLNIARTSRLIDAPTLATIFINELVALNPQPLTMILDDYHLLTDDMPHQLLGWLFDHAPPTIRVILASRTEPPLPLARWRARGMLHEINTNALRFTANETSQFLRDTMHLPISSDQVTALESRTEGWIAGLQLAALSAQGRNDLSQFVADFAGSHRYVFDYLAEEVLNRLDAETERFLLHTALLEQLTGEVCDALMQTPAGTSQRLLEKLEQAHIFIVPLDDQRRWYRYHHLFADFLRVRLQQQDSAIIPQLLSRASTWYEQHDDVDQAITLRLQAHDHVRAQHLIETYARLILMRGEALTVRGWLKQLWPNAITQSADLALIAAWAHLLTVDVVGLDEYISMAQRLMPTLDEPHQAAIRAEIATIQAIQARFSDDFTRSLTLSQEALGLLPPDELILRGILLGNIVVAGKLTGDLANATAAAHDAITINQRSGNSFAMLLAFADLGQLQTLQGQLHAAVATFQRGIVLADERGWRDIPALGLLHVGLGAVLYEWNQLDQARDHLEQAKQIGQTNGFLDIATDALLVLAHVHQAQADRAAAIADLQLAHQLSQRNNVSRFVADVARVSAKLSLQAGDLAAAKRWLVTQDLTVLRDWQHWNTVLVASSILLANGQSDQALSLIERMLEQKPHSVALRIVHATALEAEGKPRQAAKSMEQAIELGVTEHHVRSFVDAVPTIAPLIRQATGHSTYRQQLLKAMPKHEPTQTLIEPLSEREREVLAHLATGMSNAAIAERLIISVGTVKRHIINMYGKLDVHTRTEAVAKGRELGILE